MPITPGVGATSGSPEAAPALRACLFSLAGTAFAVDVRSAREVAVFDDITRIPRASRHLVGVANLRGTVVPIVDFRGLLGMAEMRPPRSVRTLLVRDGSLVVAAVVDSVLGLEPFDELSPPDTPAAPRARAPREFVEGWISWAGELVPVLDIPRLLSALTALFGGLAGLLAMVGIYGVTAYNVRRQRREYGIRLALGADPGAVQRLVITRGVLVAADVRRTVRCRPDGRTGPSPTRSTNRSVSRSCSASLCLSSITRVTSCQCAALGTHAS